MLSDSTVYSSNSIQENLPTVSVTASAQWDAVPFCGMLHSSTNNASGLSIATTSNLPIPRSLPSVTTLANQQNIIHERTQNIALCTGFRQRGTTRRSVIEGDWCDVLVRHNLLLPQHMQYLLVGTDRQLLFSLIQFQSIYACLSPDFCHCKVPASCLGQ